MMNFLLSAAGLSYRDPRKGVRVILDSIQTGQGAVTLMSLAIVVGCLAVALAWVIGGPPDLGPLPEGIAPPSLNTAITAAVIGSLIEFALLTGMILGGGKLFGGAGTFLSVSVTVGWMSLLTSPFAPFMRVRLDPEAAMMGIRSWQLGIMLFIMWMMICMIAEVHQFRSAWRVAGVFAGIIALIATLSSIMALGAA